MKFTVVLLLAGFVQVNAKGYSQITLSEKNAPLQKVFKEIKKQTGYAFLYTDEVLRDAKKVSIEVKNASLEQVLAICFDGQLLTYKIVEKTVVVQPKEKNKNVLEAFFPPSPIDISGRITDHDGNPLEGANVKIKGTGNGTTTNADGFFILKNVDENATIEISYVGFETQIIAVENKTTFNITLAQISKSLGDVVVIGYGAVKKSDCNRFHKLDQSR